MHKINEKKIIVLFTIFSLSIFYFIYDFSNPIGYHISKVIYCVFLLSYRYGFSFQLFAEKDSTLDSPTAQKRRTLRIAQIAPLMESVPPKMYGGTERIVFYLVEELVRRGHQVECWEWGRDKFSSWIPKH
jgi:hypothetical protein